MREDKKLITQEYVERLRTVPTSSFNYEGLKVDQFEELRNRLADCNRVARRQEFHFQDRRPRDRGRRTLAKRWPASWLLSPARARSPAPQRC